MFGRLISVCLCLGVLGCGKRGDTSDGAPSSRQAPPAADPVPAAADPQLATTLQELTQAVRRYGVEQRQVPKSLEELVAKGYLNSVPAAPPGKRFAIDKNLQVYVANQ